MGLSTQHQGLRIEHQPDFASRVTALVEKALAIVVRDQDTYTQAGLHLLALTSFIADVESYHAPLKEAAHRSHKLLCEAERGLVAPARQGIEALKCQILPWEQAQESLRKEEQARIERAPRRQQEDELLALAEQARAAGADQVEVDHLISQPLPPVRVVAPAKFERVAGLSTRETWHAEVRNLKQLARAVADGKEPEEFLLGLVKAEGYITSAALNAMARGAKTALNVAGVVAVRDVGTVARVR